MNFNHVAIVEKDLANKNIAELAESGFDIYNHYRLKNYHMLDTTREVYWKALFMYHVSRGWDKHYWPNIFETLTARSEILSVQLNFVKPNSVVPMHTDQYNGVDCVTNIICIRGKDVKFHMNGKSQILNPGSLVQLDGVNSMHGLDNDSDEWFVALVIDILK